MLFEYNIRSGKRTEFIDITEYLEDAIKKSGILEGICLIFVPHTTAAVTINENADPDVVRDIIAKTDSLVPKDENYRHYEGNSDAHIKASMMGFSENIIIEKGRPLLGTWQGVYFTEFDGPRNRKFYIKII